MDDALLDLGLRITGSNRLREAHQVVHTGDEDVLNTAVFEVVENTEPELRGFVLADPHAQHVLVTVQVNPDDHVGCFVDNCSILLDLKVNGVQEYHGVHALQRTVLPLFDQGNDLNGPECHEYSRPWRTWR